MLPISRFFVLSERGDTVVNKSYRNDIPRDSNEVFFREMKFWKNGDAPPVFHADGINFLWMKLSGLYFVCVTKFNVSPSLTVELLLRLSKVFKDYCGTISEESMRKNFVLIYELLDETLDYGYAQGTSTELLKGCIHNEPASLESGSINLKALSMSRNSKTKPSTAANKSVLHSSKDKKQKNDIFVDILERLNVQFNGSGVVMNQSIHGNIQMKSFLSGNPPLKLALNENLVIGKNSSSSSGGDGKSNSYSGGVVLDDATFHEVADLEEFEASRVLNFIPPDGEFSIMNYRLSNEFRPPVRMFAFFETINPLCVELVIKIRAEIPSNNYVGNISTSFTVPRTAAGVTPTIVPSDVSSLDPKLVASIQPACEYSAKDLKVTWKIKKLPGGIEAALKTRINLSSASSSPHIRKEIGPIVMKFEIPMYNASHLQVKYLRIHPAHKSYTPQRWVRYITQGGSYVCRL